MKHAAAILFLLVLPVEGAPQLLDEQFELPPGFHIYKAAEPNLTGGSYDIVFDGQGRLLVGDGNAVRRLTDVDGDQVYDKQEVIATGLGGRGPQGLVVLGDHLYAVGGDGVQLFSGYQSGGKLRHERRLGAPFSTGGDHAAHTVLRGLDGYLYFVTGDGGGAADRKHITEGTSPVLFERKASVFRFDPTGEHWECISAGGRNPPSLGMNYLGECFSFDSDMEWHVDLPFYRPVRLNHWGVGGDNGWQGVGAYPPYYLDNLPPVMEVGRGSPDWGVFYEHSQFPTQYRDAFLACDYQWKSATSGGYANPGRLVSFHVKRNGPSWKAEMTLLAQPKPGAKDARGQNINFGLVDVDVAPDGSILVSDHNQGIWRIFYDPKPAPKVTPIVPKRSLVEEKQAPRFVQLLALPQPASEWSRLRERALFKGHEEKLRQQLEAHVLDSRMRLRPRLRALRLLAPEFKTMQAGWIAKLANDSEPELRGQAAWLIGLRQQDEEVALALLEDKDAFVRRRAAECFTRYASAKAVPKLVKLLADDNRFVRYAAMCALAHRPAEELVSEASKAESPDAVMRLMVAVHLRREKVPAEGAQKLVGSLLKSDLLKSEGKQDLLDLLRVLGLFHGELSTNATMRKRISDLLLGSYPHADEDIRWEQARLLGQYKVAAGIGKLVTELEKEEDGVTQFHLADCLSQIGAGWNQEDGRRLVRWLQTTQTGWFSEHSGKGRQFPGFWNTVLTRLATAHAGTLIELADGLEPDSQLSGIAFKAIRGTPKADAVLLKALRASKGDAAKRRILGLLEEVGSPAVAAQLLEDYDRETEAVKRDILIATLASQPVPEERRGLFLHGLLTSESPVTIEKCASRLLSEGKRLEDYGEVARKLRVGKLTGAQALASRILELMATHPKAVGLLERALQVLVREERGSFEPPFQTIWISDAQANGEVAWIAREFSLRGAPASGTLVLTCDNEWVAYLNGKEISKGTDWTKVARIDVGGVLVDGKNMLTVRGKNLGGPAGLGAVLRWTSQNGSRGSLTTDTTWKVSSREPPKGWESKGSAVGSWRGATDVTAPTKNVTELMKQFLSDQSLVAGEEIQEFWQGWYLAKFGEPFSAVVGKPLARTWSDKDLHTYLKGLKKHDGDAGRGRTVYLKTTCFACHGGLGDQTGTLFGPSLGGVMQRMTAEQFADAIVFPSKEVPERFKASEVITTDGRTLSGFVTENTDQFVSVTDVQNEVTRLPKNKVKEIKSQDESLMPAKLLNNLTRQEVHDLMTFISKLK